MLMQLGIIIMRCKACDKALSDFESTRKYPESGEYVDLCNECYATIQEELEAEEREDLRDESDVEFNFDDIDSEY
jgi:hypothetical protein